MVEIKNENKIEELSKLIKKGLLLETSIVARKLNVSTKTVLNWINKADLKAIKIGGKWYVFRDSLENLIKICNIW